MGSDVVGQAGGSGPLAGPSRLLPRIARAPPPSHVLTRYDTPLVPTLPYDSSHLLPDLTMAESVYKVIELVGTSTVSWEKATAAAVSRASKTLRDLRIAEVSQLDVQIKNGKIDCYRVRVKLSFKFEGK